MQVFFLRGGRPSNVFFAEFLHTSRFMVVYSTLSPTIMVQWNLAGCI